MLDEEELQRKELQRLLGTAKDEERKRMIRKAMNDLDLGQQTDAKSVIQTLNPAVQAQLHTSLHIPVETIDPVKSNSARMRPMSARRQPSLKNLLDAIPENHSTSLVQRSKDSSHRTVLPLDDIAEVLSSCYDHSHPPSEIFSLNAKHHKKFWMSTGLVPQFLYITFYEKWIIKRVELKCLGVTQVSLKVHSHSSSYTPGHMAKAAAKAKAEAAHAEAQSKQNGGNGNISTLEASGSDSTTKRKTSINYYGNTGVTYSFSRISEGVFIFDDQDLFDGESPSENIRNDKHASDYQGGLKFGNIDNSVGSTNGETVRPSNLVKANANGNIVGGGLTITIENTSEMFFSVFEAKIEVLPYS